MERIHICESIDALAACLPKQHSHEQCGTHWKLALSPIAAPVLCSSSSTAPVPGGIHTELVRPAPCTPAKIMDPGRVNR